MRETRGRGARIKISQYIVTAGLVIITIAAMAFNEGDIAKMALVGLVSWLGGNHNGAQT